MKKSLIALAVLAAAGAASAQSSVTLFGVVDAAFQYGKGDGGDSTRLAQGGYNSSRIGFRGTEDLGGGMSASFWLEAGVNNDDGQGTATSSNNQPIATTVATVRPGTQGLTFNRRSTVSLAGGWGELRLGRDYTPQFWNLTVFDPFGTNGVGTTVTLLPASLAGLADPISTRASNSIGYFLPGNLGGFYGQVMYYMGENPEGTVNAAGQNIEDDGTGAGVRLGWASGPINVAGSYAKTNFFAGDIETWNVGGQWDFGFAKLMGHYASNSLKASGLPGTIDLDGKGWLIGGLVPVGAGEIRFSYSEYKVDVVTATLNDPKLKQFAIGYVHNLSKRTAVYTTYAFRENEGGLSTSLNGSVGGVNQDSQGLDIGIRHSF